MSRSPRPVALTALIFFCAQALFARTELPAPDLGPLHEGSCGVPPGYRDVEVPELTLPDERALTPESQRVCRELARDERKRLTTAKLALENFQAAGWDITSALDECAFWPAWRELDAAGAAAAREESEDRLKTLGPVWKVAWPARDALKLKAELASVKVPSGPLDDACRAPDASGPLYVPVPQGLPAQAAARLAGIEKAALAVQDALDRQHAALVTLLPLTQGRRCRRILTAYDRLIAGERAAYFSYREREVAAAVWGSLGWKRAGGTQAPGAPR